MVELIRERLDERGRIRPRRVSAHDRAGRGARPHARRDRQGARRRACSFEVDDAVATDRLLGRALEEGRADDTPEAIAQRLALYHEMTEPVADYYREAGSLEHGGRRAHAGRRRGDDTGRAPPRRRAPMIIRKGPEEIDRIARAGDLVAATIAHVGEHIVPGITTGELDEIAGAFIASHGGVSASKGYKGYPAEICISPNDMVVHGIPGRYRVQEGDLITIDVGAVARRCDRGQRLHLRRGGARSGRAATAGRLPGRACGRDRPGAPGQPHRRHLARRADRRRRRRLLRRAQPRRPRGRPPLSRGSACAELRRARPWTEAFARNDDRDRADDHGRDARRVRCTRTAGRSLPTTALSPRISSTRWRSRRAVRRILTPRVGIATERASLLQ